MWRKLEILMDSSQSSRERLLLASARNLNDRPNTKPCFNVCNDMEAPTANLSGTREEFSSEVVHGTFREFASTSVPR